MQRLAVLALILVMGGGGAAACGGASTPMASPTVLAEFTPTLVSTPSPTVTHTPTVEPTPTTMPTPTPIRVLPSGWEGVEVDDLCLEDNLSFPVQGPGAETAEIIERSLKRMGLRIVAPEQGCDATLRLALSGEALGAEYYDIGWCYSGADVVGSLTLVAEGRPQLTYAVRGYLPPRTLMSSQFCARESADAPFREAEQAALGDVLRGLAELWGAGPLVEALGFGDNLVSMMAVSVLEDMGVEGAPALVQALGHQDFEVSEAAKEVLVDIGPAAVPALIGGLSEGNTDQRSRACYTLGRMGPGAAEAISTLIEVLRDEHEPMVAGEAWWALKQITGEDFAKDAEVWQEWWESQQ